MTKVEVGIDLLGVVYGGADVEGDIQEHSRHKRPLRFTSQATESRIWLRVRPTHIDDVRGVRAA